MAEPADSPGAPFEPSVAAQIPPWALARLPPGRHGLPREFVARNQRNRLISAALELFTARGYVETSVADLIAAAGVSRTTYYAHFAGKEDCLLARLLDADLGERLPHLGAELSEILLTPYVGAAQAHRIVTDRKREYHEGRGPEPGQQ